MPGCGGEERWVPHIQYFGPVFTFFLSFLFNQPTKFVPRRLSNIAYFVHKSLRLTQMTFEGRVSCIHPD